MALDLNDPEVKAALTAAVDEATAGLIKKRDELLAETKELKKGRQIDPAEVQKLEDKIEALTAERDAAQADAKKAAKDAEKATLTAQKATEATNGLVVSTGLKDALIAANVAKQFIPAVEAMLRPVVQVKAEGDAFAPYVGDKTLADHVQAWAQSDAGKHFIAAPANGGGGALGDGGAQPGAKTMTRSAFDALDPASKAAAMKDKVALTE